MDGEIVYFLPDATRNVDVSEFIEKHGLGVRQNCVCSVAFDDGDLASEFVGVLEDARVVFDWVRRRGRNVGVVECVRQLESGVTRRFSSSFIVGTYQFARGGAAGVCLN